jgi:ATP-dependent protease HslVU (ClpYQ) peptidase subunit
LSHVKNLKTSVTQLKTTAGVKFAGSTAEQYTLLDDLQSAASDSFQMLKELSAKVCTASCLFVL